MTDHGKPNRAALIAGEPAPKLSIEAKRFAAIKTLGNHYILKGGKPDWTRPRCLQPGSVSDGVMPLALRGCDHAHRNIQSHPR